MANTVTVTAITDSHSLSVLHVYLASDGAAGELTDTVVFDASALIGAKNAYTIEEIEYCLIGFSARLEFDATADVPALVLVNDTPHHICLKENPLRNTAGAGKTGDITITTSGFTASGDQGHIIIRVRKA